MQSLFDAPETQPQPAIGQYNPDLARRKRDEGINNAELGAMAHIGDDWNERAFEAVQQAARVMKFLIVDDVWPFIDEAPAEGRAMGPVMLRAAREGIIERTGNYRTSARVSCHGNPRSEYRSLIYQGGGE